MDNQQHVVELKGTRCEKPLKVVVTSNSFDVNIKIEDEEGNCITELGLDYHKNKLGYWAYSEPEIYTLVDDVRTLTPSGH